MHRLIVRLATFVGAVSLALPGAAGAQAIGEETRGPQFLLASSTSSSRTVPLDVSRTPVLRQRISLHLDDVTLKEALSAIASRAGLELAYTADVLPLRSRVRLRADEITVAAALTDVLVDANVDVVFTPEGRAILKRRVGAEAVQTGTIAGRITDAKTGQGLEGTEVLLEGTKWRVLSGQDGQYRLTEVDTGSYTMAARRIGYTRQSRSVTVVEGQEATADFALQAAVTQLEELVTVQKREERLIDVPQSVTVLPTDKLVKSGILQFRDFATMVPGLIFNTSGAGRIQLSMRGVTTGVDVSSPAVANYIDEVPYGSSSAFAVASQLALLDGGLFDLDRIEVLRGPQGTLWGASAMGGLIKYVTKRPDATRFGVDVQTGISDTRHGGVSYNGAVAVNAPIVTDKAVVRATGFYSRDGGYIDNVALGTDDVNRSDIYGGRVDLLLTPVEKLSIRISGFGQDIDRDGIATVEHTLAGVPEEGSLAQRRFVAEPFEHRFRLISGTTTYELGWASLTSISSYQTVRLENIFDNTERLLPLIAPNLSGGPFSALSFPATASTDKFTQEVRLASAGSRPFEWLIGGFYTDEDSEQASRFILFDLAGQPAPINLGAFSSPSRLEEYAGFGNLTWHLTDKFNVSGGIRYARNDQKTEQLSSGLFAGPPTEGASTDDVFTYLANARYHFSDNATAYFRYATGYRAGGPNPIVLDPTTGLPVLPERFGADRLENYEVGFKAETADRRFGLDVAGYYIDWNDIQITIVRSGFGGIGNAAGGARTRGVELGLTARPITAFAVTGAFAYQGAELKEAEPDLGGAKGERLPNVPRFTAAVNADYALPWWGSLQPTVGATLRYVDDRRASFNNAAFFAQYRLADYTTVDLRAGFNIGAIDAQIYVRNLFDERGQLSTFSTPSFAPVGIMQPRTTGLNLTTPF